MDKIELAVRATQSWLLLPGLGLPLGLWYLQQGRSQYLVSLLVWMVFVPLVLTCAYLGRVPFTVLAGVGSVFACIELAMLDPDRNRYHQRLFITLLVAISLPLTTYYYTAFVPWQLVMASMSAPFWVFLRSDRTVPIWTLALYLGSGLAGWIIVQSWSNGFSYILWSFSVVTVNDIFAAVIGEIIKSPKPFPRISPNKSIAGYVGGAAAAVCAGFLGWFALPDFTGWQIILGALLLAVAGSAGDLAASWVKRRNGVKDFGQTLPTMGGVLDRLDSLLPSGWVFFLFVKFVVHL